MPLVKHIYASIDDLTQDLGSFIVSCSQQAIADHGRFTIAFSGGSAATSVCTCMNLEKFKTAVDWSKWFVFFCDERFVELTHPDSNYKAIHDGLLKNIPQIDSNKVFALDKNQPSVDAAAAKYESDLRSVFNDGSNFPSFDLLVLGMGPDGHICSLFPNHPLLKEATKWVGAVADSPKPPPERITLTLPVVNNSKDVLFYTTGKGKAENILKALEGGASDEVPASLVRPKGDAHWFMDKEASSLLTTYIVS